MEWMVRMKRALDYLEENLTGEISFEEAARLAMCSSYHFQRMFSFITNVPLAEYIRRRRLTLAAQELQYRRIDINTVGDGGFVGEVWIPIMKNK